MKTNRFVSSGIARSQNNSTLCSSYILNVNMCCMCVIIVVF